MEIKQILPHEIEAESFAIISRELGDRQFPEGQELIVKRVIHTSADFEYADSLFFSSNAVQTGIDALENGAHIVTDTEMVMAGVNKTVLAKLGGEAHCFIADPEVAKEAGERGITRSAVSMEHSVSLPGPLIYAIGNAPTALITLVDLVKAGKVKPALIIGVPVGFVNVVESKELALALELPLIVARGRKGGSNVAAAICNALLYKACPGR